MGQELTVSDYGLVGALMIGMFTVVAWILRSWAGWMMRKIDEKNHFAERMLENTATLKEIGETLKALQATQQELQATQLELVKALHEFVGCQRR